MVNEIAFYIEGGGDQKETKQKLRLAFNSFLDELLAIARSQKTKWKVVACGGRRSTFDDFCVALRQSPNTLNVLLIDAEDPIKDGCDGPWDHLRLRPGDEFQKPAGVTDTNCYLMTTCMESWIVADVNNLEKYYGAGFQKSQLPKHANPEKVTRGELADSLKSAARKTTKGEYHKTRHGFDLLQTTSPNIVRSAAPQCSRMFTVLANELGGEIG